MPKLNKVSVFVFGGGQLTESVSDLGVIPWSCLEVGQSHLETNKPDRVTVCLPASLCVNRWRHSRMPVTHQGQDQFLLGVGENGSLPCV